LASGEWRRWNLNLKFPVVFTLIDDAHAIEAGIEVLKTRGVEQCKATRRKLRGVGTLGSRYAGCRIARRRFPIDLPMN